MVAANGAASRGNDCAEYGKLRSFLQGNPVKPTDLPRLGVALYGPAWRVALAGGLGVAPSTVWRWAQGRVPMPADIESRLRFLAVRRIRDIEGAFDGAD